MSAILCKACINGTWIIETSFSVDDRTLASLVQAIQVRIPRRDGKPSGCLKCNKIRKKFVFAASRHYCTPKNITNPLNITSFLSAISLSLKELNSRHPPLWACARNQRKFLDAHEKISDNKARLSICSGCHGRLATSPTAGGSI